MLAYRGGDEVTADEILAGITADEERQKAQLAAAEAGVGVAAVAAATTDESEPPVDSDELAAES